MIAGNLLAGRYRAGGEKLGLVGFEVARLRGRADSGKRERVVSRIYHSKNAKRTSWPSRRTPLWCVVAIACGLLLMITAGIASAAILLHGRGFLTAPAVEEKSLQVSNVRLSVPLVPGGAADLLLSVRNPNAFGTRVDQIALVGALRKAKPAGCTAKVGGPITRPAGYRLPLAEQVLVGAGAKRNVVVRAAFTLAASAKTGCGFTAAVDVRGTQLTSTPSATTKPAPAPATTTPGHIDGATSTAPPPSATTTTEPAPTLMSPPPGTTLFCDPDGLDGC